MRISDWSSDVCSSDLPGHLLRNVIHFAGQVLWIFGIALLPLATVAAIEFTSPLWAGFLAMLFLGERMTLGRAAAFALGFAGILVIVRPGFIEISEGILIMLVCTFLFGATGAVTKWLTRRETAVAITFYMVLMQAVFGAAASTRSEEHTSELQSLMRISYAVFCLK